MEPKSLSKYPKRGSQMVKCQYCHKDFRAYNHDLAAGSGKFCSIRCKANSQRNTVDVSCQSCGSTIKARPSEIRKGLKYCSWDCRITGMRGSGNPKWSNDPDYRGWDWRKARLQALERDNHQCQECGSEKKLVVHHLIPWEQSHDNSLSNLLTLCISCHIPFHR